MLLLLLYHFGSDRAGKHDLIWVVFASVLTTFMNGGISRDPDFAIPADFLSQFS